MSWLDRPCGCWKLDSHGRHYHYSSGSVRTRRRYRKGRWPWWSDLTAGQRRAKEKREAGLDDRRD